MTDWQAYREAPLKMLGMSKKDALKYLDDNNFHGMITQEDGVVHTVIAIVSIHLNVKNGIVIGTDLNGSSYGVW